MNSVKKIKGNKKHFQLLAEMNSFVVHQHGIGSFAPGFDENKREKGHRPAIQKGYLNKDHDHASLPAVQGNCIHHMGQVVVAMPGIGGQRLCQPDLPAMFRMHITLFKIGIAH